MLGISGRQRPRALPPGPRPAPGRPPQPLRGDHMSHRSRHSGSTPSRPAPRRAAREVAPRRSAAAPSTYAATTRRRCGGRRHVSGRRRPRCPASAPRRRTRCRRATPGEIVVEINRPRTPPGWSGRSGARYRGGHHLPAGPADVRRRPLHRGRPRGRHVTVDRRGPGQGHPAARRGPRRGDIRDGAVGRADDAGGARRRPSERISGRSTAPPRRWPPRSRAVGPRVSLCQARERLATS